MTVIDDSDLLHRRAYDPQQAHAYYIRTRHLKGRQPGQVRRSSGQTSGQTKTTAHRSSQAKTAEAVAVSQRSALENRLEHLRDVLAELVAQAKRRAGADTPTKKKSESKTDTKKEPEKKSKLTEAEKKEKAKKERERYKKHPDKKDPPTPHDTIPELQAKIADIRRQIEQAIEKNRRSKSTKTAAKGR